MTNIKKAINSKLQHLKELREGSEAGEELSHVTDKNSIDDLNAADTTVYPSYIDENGKVKHKGPRKDIVEKIS